MNPNKKKVQFEALKAWMGNGFKGAIEMVTGSGKTRIGVIAAFEFIKRELQGDPEYRNESSLIICYTKPTRDREWPDEITKWGYGEYLDMVPRVCIQSAYKYENQSFGTLVVDEADTIFANEEGKQAYLSLLRKNNFKRIILLTALFEEYQKPLLEEFGLPIVYQIGYEEALKYQLISPFTIVNVGIELNQKEKVYYEKLDAQIFTAKQLVATQLEVTDKEAYKAAQNYVEEANKKYKSVKYRPPFFSDCVRYLSLVSSRKQFLYNAESKFNGVINICKDVNDKCILFSESIDFASQLREKLDTRTRRCYLYHSKQNDKRNKHELDLFRKSKKGILSSAKALNRGINVPDCSLGIISSGTSSKRDFIQRLGREVRLSDNPNKQAILIQPYLIDTQDFYWTKNRCGELPVQWTNINNFKSFL
jgi:RNA polymerase primary sigma factor